MNGYDLHDGSRLAPRVRREQYLLCQINVSNAGYFVVHDKFELPPYQITEAKEQSTCQQAYLQWRSCKEECEEESEKGWEEERRFGCY